MSRGTQVKFEDVAQACAELFRAGESVSFAKVYQRIGSRGGQQVVTDMIRRWRQDIAQRLLAEREHSQLPPALVQASDGLIASLWQQALSQAQQGYLQQAEVLAQREIEWQQKLDAAQAAVDQVGRENLEIKAELARAQGELQAREVAHQELVQRHQALQGQLSQAERERVLAREQVGQLEAALEGERQRHVEAVEALKAQHASELRQVRVQADSDRKHLMVQTDELRQAHRAQAAQLREQLAGERVAVETSRQQLNAAREAGARWQGRAEVAQQELVELKAQAAKAQEDASRWQGRADALQEALAAARQQVDALSERLGAKKEASQPGLQDDKN